MPAPLPKLLVGLHLGGIYNNRGRMAASKQTSCAMGQSHTDGVISDYLSPLIPRWAWGNGPKGTSRSLHGHVTGGREGPV